METAETGNGGTKQCMTKSKKESTLDPSLKPILKYRYISSPRAIAEPFDNASPTLNIFRLMYGKQQFEDRSLTLVDFGSSSEADGGKHGDETVDPARRRIQDLEKQLRELKAAKSEQGHESESESDIRKERSRRFRGY